MKFSSLLPEEIRNASLANKDLAAVAGNARNNLAFLLFNFLVMVVGASCGYVFREHIDKDMLETLMTFSGVVIGFVITAMLFSGRSAFALGLSFEQVKVYRLKTKYMLLSQANTLFAFIFCLAFCVASVLSLKASAAGSAGVFIATAFAYFFLGAYRTLLLPYQIYDVHCFSLDNLVDETVRSVKNDVKSASEARLSKLR